jgi:Alpha/beta hydrolase family
VTHLVLDDPLLDAQTLRAAGLESFGGALPGEVIATANRVQGTDLDSWYAAWSASGQVAFDQGEAALAAGARESARLAFWRASTYFRTAGLMLLQPPLDDRLKGSNQRQTDAFRRGAALMAQPPELLEIPYEGTTLPGYFFRVDDDARPRATVIVTGGYDGTAEELYFYNAAAALARGYNVLAFDGPGQGAALIQRGLTLRPDWEQVVTPVVDVAVARADVDAERVALIGPSLGGYLAPRAASGEHRLAACIGDCGAFDLYAAFLARLPEPMRSQFDAGDQEARTQIKGMLEQMAAQPTGGWSLRRGLLVHGVPDVLALVDEFRGYSLAGRAEHISCPTFVCNAEGDAISASAPDLVAALTCPHEFVTFTAAEGAGDHCEAGARNLYHARSFGWLDPILHPRD